MSPPAGPRAWLHVRVEGRVQGVGFRRFVKRAAAVLGLRGWVRNLADGSVEVSAVGSPDATARLRAQLGAGPPYAHVARVVDVAGGAEPREPGFRIIDGDATADIA